MKLSAAMAAVSKYAQNYSPETSVPLSWHINHKGRLYVVSFDVKTFKDQHHQEIAVEYMRLRALHKHNKRYNPTIDARQAFAKILDKQVPVYSDRVLKTIEAKFG